MTDHLRELDQRRSTPAARSSLSEQLVRQSIAPMESPIPPDMTLAEWRRQRASCEHVHDSTTRYDHDRKLLTFLLVCSVCGTEKVVETMHYEPRFERHVRRAA